MAKLRVDKIAAPIVKDEFTGSVHFDGTGDYLSLSSNTDFAMGTGDFTAECFINTTSFSNAEGAYSERVFDSNTGQLGIYVTSDGSGTIGALVAGTDHRGTSSPTLSGWTHVALTRSGSTVRIFLNGVLDSSFTNSGSVASSGDFLIGARASGQGGFLGYISNFRICKGHAVYTGNFTVPTRELEVHLGAKGVVFPAADNRTVLLACQSSTDATAEATGRHTITVNGDPTAADANPGLFRRTNISSTTTENTGAVYFDGSGDYLSLATSTDFSFSHDFTVETWAYPTDISSKYNAIFSLNVSGEWNSQGKGFVLSIGNLHYGTGYNTDYTTGIIPINTWTHLAVTRLSGAIKIFVNGVLDQTINDGNSDDTFANGTGNTPAIGLFDQQGGTPRFYFTGYISNFRVCKGHAVYTSQFIPPTRELEVTPETVFLGLYDGENIFADKTERHIIAAYGDRTSSPTPTVTDSPIGITTNYPPVTRNVDPTAGPIFQGGAGFISQNWLTLPKGTTLQRSRGRGLFGGGYTTSYTNVIEYIEIHTLGNGQDFGDLSIGKTFVSANSSSTRCVFSGGYAPSASRSEIEYVNISTSGNVQNFATAVSTQHSRAACGNNTRGIIASGSLSDAIEYITFSTLGQSNVFGTYTIGQYRDASGCSSPTRGIFAGGFTPANTNSIQYVTISTIGNTQDFGDLSSARYGTGATSSETRGVFFGGTAFPSATGSNVIEYITISTLGNTQDFGDLSRSTYRSPCTSNGTRAVIYSSSPTPNSNAIEYVNIASLGNAADFGDSLISAREYSDSASSDSHGGIS